MVPESSLDIARERIAVTRKERERVFQREILRIKEQMNGRNVLRSSMTQTEIADAIRRELETRSSQFLEVFKRVLTKEDLSACSVGRQCKDEVCRALESSLGDLRGHYEDAVQLLGHNRHMPLFEEMVGDELSKTETDIDLFCLEHAVPQQTRPNHLQKTVVFIDESRIEDLRRLQTEQWDLTRLIRLCEELNISFSNECYMSVAALTRTVLDHVPPIFRCGSFAEVSNNYKGSKSFKESMQHLDKSARKIGDAHLHTQIRNKEVLPNAAQVNFSNDLDVLLGEIVRILS